jgi:hypothetical protein
MRDAHKKSAGRFRSPRFAVEVSRSSYWQAFATVIGGSPPMSSAVHASGVGQVAGQVGELQMPAPVSSQMMAQ